MITPEVRAWESLPCGEEMVETREVSRQVNQLVLLSSVIQLVIADHMSRLLVGENKQTKVLPSIR